MTLSGLHKDPATPNPFCRSCKWRSRTFFPPSFETDPAWDSSEEARQEYQIAERRKKRWLKKCETNSPECWSHPYSGPDPREAAWITPKRVDSAA